MKNNLFDTPIMLLFFNRPEPLKQVFDWVRSVKPSQLFLVQDGPRTNRPDDVDKILECQKIVENIDWPCEVHRNYSDKNLTCDEREFSGISWCFEYVDRLIILEDDCLPSFSFYGFCGELLEKYKDDDRVYMIAGFNRIGNYEECPYDYNFSHAMAGWGWATWKRAWKETEKLKELEFLNDEELKKYYKRIVPKKLYFHYHNAINNLEKAKKIYDNTKIVPTWENLVGISMYMNERLCIVPKRNMIKYLGITKNATHCVDDYLLIPHKTKKVLMQPAYEHEGEIKHPPFVVRDIDFEKRDYTIFWGGSNLLKKIESFYLKCKYKRWDLIKKSLLGK